MTKDDALKLALEFIENSECGTADLEARIKKALAQHDSVQAKPEPKQEPVATWENHYGMKEWQVHALRAGWSITPPQRKPLTDEEIEKCYETTGHYQTLRPQDRFAVFALARAIEAAHGIKENT